MAAQKDDQGEVPFPSSDRAIKLLRIQENACALVATTVAAVF